MENQSTKKIDGKEFAQKYHSILCPDVPDFIYEYATLPILQRLDGVGLLCGTDWTPLFDNKFFYSRLDHSIGVALIIWNFTHDKRQTLAGLFHDVSTPAFSHVIDFKNGDTENQESTEAPTREMINDDLTLSELLFSEGIYKYEIDNYHKYPIADSPRPRLNADRLEYMYPSAAAFSGLWTLDEIKENYSYVTVLKNEDGIDELGFTDTEAASLYANRFLDITTMLQKNEDKLSMKLLADVVECAIKCGFLSEGDLYELEEKSIVRCFDLIAKENQNKSSADVEKFSKLWRTFRGMKKIVRSDTPVKNAYNVSLDVKKRYVNPLVKTSLGNVRVSRFDGTLAKRIEDFSKFRDITFGAVTWL